MESGVDYGDDDTGNSAILFGKCLCFQEHHELQPGFMPCVMLYLTACRS